MCVCVYVCRPSQLHTRQSEKRPVTTLRVREQHPYHGGFFRCSFGSGAFDLNVVIRMSTTYLGMLFTRIGYRPVSCAHEQKRVIFLKVVLSIACRALFGRTPFFLVLRHAFYHTKNTCAHKHARTSRNVMGNLYDALSSWFFFGSVRGEKLPSIYACCSCDGFLLAGNFAHQFMVQYHPCADAKLTTGTYTHTLRIP